MRAKGSHLSTHARRGRSCAAGEGTHPRAREAAHLAQHLKQASRQTQHETKQTGMCVNFTQRNCFKRIQSSKAAGPSRLSLQTKPA